MAGDPAQSSPWPLEASTGGCAGHSKTYRSVLRPRYGVYFVAPSLERTGITIMHLWQGNEAQSSLSLALKTEILIWVGHFK